MSELQSRVSYLRGLAAGLDLEARGMEGRVLTEMIAVLDMVADDLDALEEVVYGECECDDEPYHLLEVCCPQCGQTLALGAGEVGANEGVGVVCPACGGVVYDQDEAVTAHGTGAEQQA